MSAIFKLICWVIGTPAKRIFTVRVGHEDVWDDVKKAIKEEKKPEFDDIAADTLDLWKVNIDGSQLPLVESEDFLKNVIATNPLNPVGPLSTVLNDPLPVGHINIIVVQRPRRLFPSGITRDKTRKVTPSLEVLELAALRPEIQKTLDIIRTEIEIFLRNPELPEWVPASTSPNVSEFLRNLRIPAYQNGSPSLLFHNLGCQGANAIFDQRQNIFICNTSGSGKTRLILEGLIKYWGLYFVAARDENNVGVDDLENALKDIGLYEDWTDDLRSFEGPAQKEREESNIHISNRAVKKVLAARLVVFELFLQLAEARDGSILPQHRRIWLLFQLCNPLPGFETPHPFITMKWCLDRASDRALTSLIHDFQWAHRRYLPRSSKFLITLDEAQVASRLNRFSFLSSTDGTKSRSVLREIVKVFSLLVSQIVVSGTGLSLEDVEDDLISGVGKPLGRFETFVDFGMLDDPLKLAATLGQYVPPFILKSDSGKSLQLRIREYLPGRYRFLVSFLELLLKNGMESPHTLLNEYLAQYLLGPPGDIVYAMPFTSHEPPLRSQLRVRTFDWERLRQNLSDVRQVVAIIQSHLIKGSTPTFGPLPHKHVEYGIARLRPDHQSEIIEPLAFLSIMRWLETQKDLCLEPNLI